MGVNVKRRIATARVRPRSHSLVVRATGNRVGSSLGGSNPSLGANQTIISYHKPKCLIGHYSCLDYNANYSIQTELNLYLSYSQRSLPSKNCLSACIATQYNSPEVSC